MPEGASAEDLVEELGRWIVDRRLMERVRKGAASYRQASTGVTRFVKEGMLVEAAATGEPAQWEKMLDELVAQFHGRLGAVIAPELWDIHVHMRHHGFLPDVGQAAAGQSRGA